jgi:hypothetical protein
MVKQPQAPLLKAGAPPVKRPPAATAAPAHPEPGKVSRWLFYSEAAELWRVSEKTVKRWANKGLVPVLRFSRQTVFVGVLRPD